MSKIITLDEAENTSKQLHSLRKKIVVAGGCFDILHIGHITLLENAKKEGDVLIVLLESDDAIRKRKGIERPIHSQKERAHMVSLLEPVNIVVMLSNEMNNDDYDDLLQKIHPEIIATTENDAYIEHKKRQAELVGAKIIQVNKYIPHKSSSKLLEVIAKEI